MRTNQEECTLFGQIEFGPLSNWVSGTVTLMAFIAAFVYSRRGEKQQRDERLAAVFAWFEISASADERRGTLWVANQTDYPVYNWRVRVEWPSGDSPAVHTLGHLDVGILPPRQQHHFVLRGDDSTPLPANDADVSVDLRFVDANGRPLRRVPGGRLERLSGGVEG